MSRGRKKGAVITPGQKRYGDKLGLSRSFADASTLDTVSLRAPRRTDRRSHVPPGQVCPKRAEAVEEILNRELRDIGAELPPCQSPEDPPYVAPDPVV